MSPTKSSRRLQYKLLAPLLGTGLLLALVLHFYWLPARLVSVRSDFQQVQKRILAVLNPALVGSLLSNDIAQVYSMLEQVAQDMPHWTALTLIDAKGQRLYPTVAQAVAPDKRMARMVSFDEALNYRGTTLGRLQVMADPTDAIQEATDQLLSTQKWILLLLAMTAGLIGWLQSRIVMRPLQQLAAAANRLAASDFSAELPHASQDEVGHLVRAFGAMRENQQRAREEILRLNAGLEERVQQRTEELQSQQALLRDSEAILSATINTALDAVVQMDAAEIITGWNTQAEEIFGWKQEEAIGQMLSETIIPPQYREAHIRGMKHFLVSGEGPVLNKRIEISALHRDGHEFPIELSITPLKIADKYEFSAFIRDITERKQAGSALMLAKDAAEQANQVKSAFLANMSHEIRTPLNGIIGMTELALDTELNAEQREYIGLVKVSADALLLIVNDILDFSKIEAGHLEIENIEFSLEQMLQGTMKSLAVRAHQKGLELLLHVAPDVPDRLISDPGRLRQVLVNLVGNAIKFTQTGEIEVAVYRTDAPTQTQTELRFSVRDTGIGIAHEKFKAIFDSFSQADTSTTRQYGGTGLGLTISAQLVSLMGGHIGVESELGQGSTFYFTLSLATGSNDAYSNYQSTARLNGLPVLIADDNASNRSLLVDMLLNWQMLPTAVASGEQALQELARASASATPYALAILDVEMPVMDGFELAQRILAQPKYGAASVMMLTSEDQRGQATRCRELGIASYLMKPILPSELLNAIMAALGQASQSSTPGSTRHSLRENRRKLNLLLAEDNVVNQTLAVRLLQKLGHSVTVANNGLEAVEHWQAGRFDAILMDVDMPVMNGYEATERIRAIEKTSQGLVPAHTPIVAMTAHAMRGARELCLSHGMDAYLAKPIATEALWRELDGLMPVSVAEPEPATAVPPPAKVSP